MPTLFLDRSAPGLPLTIKRIMWSLSTCILQFHSRVVSCEMSKRPVASSSAKTVDTAMREQYTSADIVLYSIGSQMGAYNRRDSVLFSLIVSKLVTFEKCSELYASTSLLTWVRNYDFQSSVYIPPYYDNNFNQFLKLRMYSI